MTPKFEGEEFVQDQGTMAAKKPSSEKHFNDAVHGVISLPPLCVQIVDTPQFQRLRFLKSLGPVYLVFPSAAQNRFEHCLGVCHIAGQLARALQSRQPELNITDKDVLCVQLAGLCHDLGHGPFSHLWEIFVNKARPGKKWTHESASIQMFDHLLEKNDLKGKFEENGLKDEDIKFIKEMIAGPDDTSSENWPYKGRTSAKAFLYEIVSNKRSGVDVDKWDYFLRDSHSLGIKVTFDYQRLILFSRVINVEGEGRQICFQDKEVDTLYDMFHARFVLHRTAYQHRVVKLIDSMLVDAFCYADKHIQVKGEGIGGGKKYFLADACDDMGAYTNLVDDVFHQIIRAEGDHPDLSKAKNIINDILTRKLYSCVGHTQPTPGNIKKEELMDTLVSNIPHNIPHGTTLTRDDLDIQEVRINYGMGDRDPIECVRFYNKHNVNKATGRKRDTVSRTLPQSFQDVEYWLAIKKSDSELHMAARRIFEESCTQLGLELSPDCDPVAPVNPVECSNGR